MSWARASYVADIVGGILNDPSASALLPLEPSDALLGRKPKRVHIQKYYELLKIIIRVTAHPSVAMLMQVMDKVVPGLDSDSHSLQCWALKRLVSRVRDIARCKSIPRQWEVRELRYVMVEQLFFYNDDNASSRSEDDGDQSDSSDGNPAHSAQTAEDNQSPNTNK
jgi:hypothetical protein